jgi:DNA invertase Pin-like site-specific DNA recombinase
VPSDVKAELDPVPVSLTIMETAAKRGARYARISEDLQGDEHGVNNQDSATGDHTERRGIKVAPEHVYSDNDISATYGKHRPRYTAMMEAAARGEFDVIVVFHTSRLWRNRRERAEGIEILKEAGVSVEAVKGPSLDMTTAYGRGMADMVGAFDSMESEIKSERQALAAQGRARAGKVPLGVRLTGYTAKGEIIEEEAAVVRRIFSLFYSGESIKGIARHLNETGVPTRRGRTWRPPLVWPLWDSSSVSDILTNPRYCGRSVYNRHAGGTDWTPGSWKPIVEEHVFDTVNAKLADPRRKLQEGTERKHLGASVYQCPNGHPVRSHGTPTRYRCKEGCVTRSAAPIDEAVTKLIHARLALPDVMTLVNAPTGKETTAAAKELERQRGRLVQVEADYDEDLIDGKRYKEKRAKIEAEIGMALARLRRLGAGAEVAGVLTAADPVQAYEDAPLGVQQSVIRFFMDVTLLPAPRGRRGFDPETIRIVPKHPARPRLQAASAVGDTDS